MSKDLKLSKIDKYEEIKDRKKPPIRLRKAGQEDVNFIFSSWLKSYKYSHFARDIIKTIYYSEHHKVIENCLQKYETLIACSVDDPTQIYGFINAGREEGIFCVNYVYIKHAFRNLGIGKALVNSFDHDFQTASVVTHTSKVVDRLLAKYNMIYHPYILFNLEPTKEVDEQED